MPEDKTADGLVVTAAVRDVTLSLVPWLRSGSSLLLVGPEGCGKAQLLQHCFKQLPVRLLQNKSCLACFVSTVLVSTTHLTSRLTIKALQER